MTPGADDLLTRPIALVVALALVSLLPFAFMTSSPPFQCFCARGTLTIAGIAPITWSLGGLYHDTDDERVWMLIPLGETPAELDLDGRAFTLDITLNVFGDYASTDLRGVIDDPRS